MKQLLQNRNILLFLFAKTFWIPFFWLPILYLYLTEYKDLSPLQATFLLGLQEFALIFLEIPTGVLADKISRRYSVAIGYILNSLPFVFLPFVEGYGIILLLFLIKSVGKAFISGADSSLIYDTLADIGKTEEFKRIASLGRSLFTGFMALCIFIGGLLTPQFIHATLILPFPFMLAGAIAILFMKEPETTKKGMQLQQENYLKHTSESFAFVLKRTELYIPIVLFVLSDALAVNMKWFYTPILSEAGFNITFIAGFMAFLYIIKSVLAGIVTLLSKWNTVLLTRIANFTLAFAFLLLAIVANQFFSLFFLFIALIGSELLDTVAEQNVHDRLEGKTRATAMSIINLLGSVGATIMIAGWGAFLQYTSVAWAVAFIGILFFIGLALSLLGKNQVQSKTVES